MSDEYTKTSDYLDENYIPSIAYDPEVALQALQPDNIRELITNQYYFKASIRFLKVVLSFIKILIDYWYDKQKWTYFKQWIKTASIDKAESNRRAKRAQWLRKKLLKLGPTFIKIGQALSTRGDLLKREYIDELSRLQDKVPPFDFKIAKETIEKELGKPLNKLYKSVEPEPLAAASLGQVHRAKLFTGEEVVIKVQRQNLIEIVNLDLAILKKVAIFCRKYLPFAKDRNWPEIVDEFGKTIFEEIDYELEAKNAILMRQNCEEIEYVYIPAVFKKLVSRNVITLEYKPGIKIDNIKALDAHCIDREQLSHNCLEVYLKQFLRDGIYHADPHPGNLSVDPATEQIIFYDFGMIGRIDPKTKLRMLSAFINVVNRRADDLLKDFIALQIIDRNTKDLDKIRNVIQWTMDNYYDVAYEDVRFSEISDELADIMYAFPFRLPASFTYIVRALVTLEGLSIKLNPKIRFDQIAIPFARKYLTPSELYELFKRGHKPALYKFLIDTVEDFLGIDLHSRLKKQSAPPSGIDKEDIEIIRKQIINGFGVIGFGIIICITFSILSVSIAMINSTIASTIFISLMLITLPIYFAIMLAVLLSRPMRPKDLLKKHLEQKNKFESY